jgi:hypothetical protein
MGQAVNLDRTTVIAGLPIKTARDAIREMHRNDINRYGWSVLDLAAYMEVSSTQAEWLCETLQKRGILERKPQPGTRWHPQGTYYSVSETGTRFTNATMLKRIDRVKVDEIVAGLLERARKINADNRLCYFINEIRLFGSATDHKAESFSDVDICCVMERRKVPSQYKSWADWNVARAKSSGRDMMYFDELFYGEREVKRMLKNRSPYISVHDINDVVGIGAESVRLFIAPEGAIEAQGGGTSGEALAEAAVKAAVERKTWKTRQTNEKHSSQPLIWDDSPKEQMIRAVKSLAFDILRAIDESMPSETLERSIEVTYEHVKAYRAMNESESVANILRDALSIDMIEQKVPENNGFVFSGDRERRALDGTDDSLAAKKSMKRAVISVLKCAVAGRQSQSLGMPKCFDDYAAAQRKTEKYYQQHGYDFYGPESLSNRALVTLRGIASRTEDKLDKQALKTLTDRGFIKPFRKTWRRTAKGEAAIRYHHERDAWQKQQSASSRVD